MSEPARKGQLETGTSRPPCSWSLQSCETPRNCFSPLQQQPHHDLQFTSKDAVSGKNEVAQALLRFDTHAGCFPLTFIGPGTISSCSDHPEQLALINSTWFLHRGQEEIWKMLQVKSWWGKWKTGRSFVRFILNQGSCVSKLETMHRAWCERPLNGVRAGPTRRLVGFKR